MKSSKKLITRILTAALALSMVTGTTGVCASAVEDTLPEEEAVVIMAPEDGEQSELSKLDAVKALLEAAAKNAYAKLSATTAAKLVEIAQKTKMAKEIIVNASNKAAEIQAEATRQAVEIMNKVSETIAELKDEETIVQIVHEAEQQADEILKAAEEQAAQLMAQAKETSDALLAEANAQLDAIKAKLSGKTMQTIADIQVKIYAAQAQIKTLVAQASQFLADKLVKVFTVTEGDFTFNIRYGLAGASAMVTAYSGTDTEVNIPAYIRGIPVYEVAMFSTTNVQTINFPATVRKISGLSAVMFKELQNMNVDPENPYFQSIDGIVFDKTGTVLCAVPQGREYNAPEGITAIGDFAYYMSPMSSIEIPSTVTSIGMRAFGVCENLEEVTIPSGVVSLGVGAFQYCSNLKKVFIPASVQTIGDFAFSQTSDDFVVELETVSCPAYIYVRVNEIPYNCPIAASISLDSDNYFVQDEEHFVAVELGSTLTMTGSAEGGSKEGYQYAFYIRKEGDTKWACKQSYKANDSIQFKPEFTGNYELCVKVKDSTGTVAKMYMDLYVKNAFENTSTVSDEVIKKGQTVTVNCSADGVDTDEVSYAVYYKKTTDTKWVTKQNYSENTEVTIKPAKASEYVICVKAKNINTGTISKQYLYVTVEA